MEKKNLSRREFIKETIATSMVIGSSGFISGCSVLKGKSSDFDSKGLPTAVLGKTGVRVPRMAVGLGSRFCNIDNAEDAVEMLEYALDNGLYYWDTAHIYENTKNGVVSEERAGLVVKNRRNEIFLSTKVTSRDPDEAKKQIELSLKRLQTDHLDILKIHNVRTMEDVNKISEKGNLIDIISKLKEQKVTKFIGFSGHASAEALKALAERGNFDTMLMAMNHYDIKNNPQKRQEMVIPVALEKGMGVMLMKVIRPRENNPSFTVPDLIRFALSLEGPTGITVGMDSLEVVKSNLEILRNFKPMSAQEMNIMAANLTPYFNHENLPWMKSGYQDGEWS